MLAAMAPGEPDLDPVQREVGAHVRHEHITQRTPTASGAQAWAALLDDRLPAVRLLALALNRSQQRTLRELIGDGVLELVDESDGAISLDLAQPAGGARQRWTLRRDRDELTMTVDCEIVDPEAFERFEHRGGRVQAYLRRRLLREAATRASRR
jgi:hypothetical protein